MLDNMDKALAEQVGKIGDLTPELIEKIAAAHTEYYATSGHIGIWFSSIGIVFFLLATVITVILHDDYDLWGFASVIFVLCAFGCFVCLNDSILQAKAPNAYAVKELTKTVISKQD